VDLDQEVRKAIDNRTDLASARLALKSADSTLAFRRNQMRYSLDVNATYTLQGLAGDTRAILADPNFGIPYVPPDNGRGIGDAFEPIPKLDFPTYRVSVTLGIPIGNRAEEAQYSSARLQREQAAIAYEDFEQAAIVQVGVAVRRVQTDRKRIEAAEKNRILQEKKVEAEQKKFENGLSTSFQVLTFQNDLAEALSAENQARVDYRISLANLDNVTGVLDQAHGVRIGDYARD
jgi:outer membrane protein TolC